jgi:hypothetical protein
VIAVGLRLKWYILYDATPIGQHNCVLSDGSNSEIGQKLAIALSVGRAMRIEGLLTRPGFSNFWKISTGDIYQPFEAEAYLNNTGCSHEMYTIIL